MKSQLVVLSSFLIICTVGAQTPNAINDLPANLSPGDCYVRCYKDEGEKVDWKAIDCVLINYQKLAVFQKNELSKSDKKTLDKIFKKFIRKGYTLQLDSYFTSSNSIEYNVNKSRSRAITVANYLVNKVWIQTISK